MNAVIAAVGLMLVLSLCRVHVVIALTIGALAGGWSVDWVLRERL